LLQHGLLAPSFIPRPEIREIRELTRCRAELVRDRAAVANRLQKELEDANIKLGSVAGDVLGASGRDMIRAMIDGQEDPEKLADLARRQLRGKIPELRRALLGRVTGHHRFLLELLMDQIDALERLIGRLDERIDEAMRPFDEAAGRLQQIPGVGDRAAEVIMGEIGPDMKSFPTAGHLCSWAGLCPGNDQSAGKRRSGKTTKGSPWLRSLLVQSAWSASHAKDTAFSACYRRWVPRLGKKKALIAVAHKILVVIWHLLKEGTSYRERRQPLPAS
jgi:transposase